MRTHWEIYIYAHTHTATFFHIQTNSHILVNRKTRQRAPSTVWTSRRATMPPPHIRLARGMFRAWLPAGVGPLDLFVTNSNVTFSLFVHNGKCWVRYRCCCCYWLARLLISVALFAVILVFVFVVVVVFVNIIIAFGLCVCFCLFLVRLSLLLLLCYFHVVVIMLVVLFFSIVIIRYAIVIAHKRKKFRFLKQLRKSVRLQQIPQKKTTAATTCWQPLGNGNCCCINNRGEKK